MSESAPHALFLDLDGTVADSLPTMRAAYEAFLRQFGKEGNTPEFDELNGPALSEIVQILRTRHRLEPTAADLQATYGALVEELYAAHAKLNRGARELLTVAEARSIPVVIVTSALRSVAERFLEANELSSRVAFVVTAEGLPRSKPDSTIYRKALDQIGFLPEQVWAVEDSANGLSAAVGAGLRTFALVSAGMTSPEVAGVYARVESLLDLASRLEGAT